MIHEDIIKLNSFPCFKDIPYNHDTRLILVRICYWLGLDAAGCKEATKIFWSDKGVYDKNKHMHHLGQINHIYNKKYLVTCKSNEKIKCCCKCNNRFMYKLNFIPEYNNALNKYKGA